MFDHISHLLCSIRTSSTSDYIDDIRIMHNNTSIKHSSDLILKHNTKIFENYPNLIVQNEKNLTCLQNNKVILRKFQQIKNNIKFIGIHNIKSDFTSQISKVQCFVRIYLCL